MTTSNFFAILNHAGNRIRSISLTQEAQKNLFLSFSRNLEPFQSKTDVNYKDNPFYTPNFKEEIFLITDFDDTDGLLKSVSNPTACEALKTEQDMLEIKAIYTKLTIDSEDIIVIKGFNKSKIITTSKNFFFFSDDTFDELAKPSIIIDDGITATYNNKNELRFFSFAAVKQIFEMNSYYTIATDDTVDEFIKHGLFDASDEIDKKLFDQSMKTKVYSITKSGILDLAIEDIIVAAKILRIEIITKKNKIALPSNKGDLKNLLRFLDEDYWQSPLSERKYFANSKRKI